MKRHRRRFLQLAGAAAVVPAVWRSARAETYPSRPVRLIIGYLPGGSADMTARLFGQLLSERLGQQFIVESRAGGSTNIATEAVIHAPPDGYTLFLASPANATNAALYDKLNFVFLRDVEPVASLIRFPDVVDVTLSLPVHSIPELIAYAKANPGALNFASSGVGSTLHVAGELFKMMTGVNIVHVPYRGGAPAMIDLMSGRAQLMFDNVPTSLEFIKAGKIRPLAVTSTTRSEVLPDLPTVADYVPGYEASAWYGVVGPLGTPKEIVDRLNHEINTILADPAVQSRLADLGALLLPGSPGDFRQAHGRGNREVGQGDQVCRHQGGVSVSKCQTVRSSSSAAASAGWTTALSLLQRGLDVVVYEQAPVLREVGAGVQIGSNGTHVLYALGLEQALTQFRVVPPRRQLRHWRTGETWNWHDLGATSVQRYGTPHILMHRNDLHGVLVDAVRTLKPDAIKLGMRCASVTQSGGEVTVQFVNGETTIGSALIGADGIHSQVRQGLFGASKAEFTGCVAWRGLAPMDRLPPHLSQLLTTNWLGPRGHVLHYPVRRGELMNFISIVERDDWQVESWIVAGTRDELAADFRDWHADVHTFIDNIDTPYKWALFARGAMERWSTGRITLLGDACHPTLPFLGQGAVMAIEDAVSSARACISTAADPERAFARYEDIRKERTSSVVRRSHDNRRHVFSPDLADSGALAAEVARYWQQEHVKERLDWLYQYDATSIAI